MNDRDFGITLRIGDRCYPLKIDRSEEGLIRKAGEEVTKQLTEYRNTYKGGQLQEQDFLSMVAFRLAYANLKLRESRDIDVLVDELDKIDQELSDYLEKRSNNKI